MVRLSRSSQQRASRGLCGARRSGWRLGRPGQELRGGCQPRRLAPAGAARGDLEVHEFWRAQPFPAQAGTARSPSGPSSPRAVARTLASTTITIGAQRRYRRLQRNRTSRAAARPVKDLLKGRSLASSMSRALKYSWRDWCAAAARCRRTA